MRDFSWNMFCATGDVDAYLLYKEISNGISDNLDQDVEEVSVNEDMISEHLS
ncbi:YqzL family protein [Paenibacillus sp. N1-5-1-14]|uniref:YqzL family protein n=1 Tax=Paenibacillus radicibacter TaxID=2972488 RepID=UPI0021592AEB|nr:YqzL family protein [Paenibacillus radicibacter]MCR8641970.1 YqzL family protein [Paenibacillus radicibacter]